MAVQTRPGSKPRTTLSRDRVLRAAIQLADEAGIEALTMRRLAKELGVEAMTLYYHVANKDEILRGIVDLVTEEMEPTADSGDPKAALRASSVSAHKVLMRHRWAASLMLSGEGSPMRFDRMDALLRCLRRWGFSPEMTHHAYHALESHVMGFTLWLVAMALDAEKLPGLAAAFLETFPREQFPSVAEHIETHMRPMTEYTGSEFEFGLDLILDALERMLPPA